MIRCDSYDDSAVQTAFARGIGLLGESVSDLFRSGETILIKPNMLQATPPEQAACVHPSVFGACAQWLKEQNVVVTYGDSPAIAGPQHAANRNGIADMARRLDIPMADFRNGRDVPTPEGCQIRRFHIANGVLDADGLVAISKLKTHGFTSMTGAVKNQLGCVPGLRKAEFHARFPDPSDFSRMLVELTVTVAPRLYVMDGILAMEGKGPNAGDPRPMNVLLFSVDPVALDTVAADIIGLPSDKLHVLEHGESLELGVTSSFTVVGDPIDSLKVSEFKIPDVHHMNVDSFLVKLFREWIAQKPVILPERCIECGQCEAICPVDPKAVQLKSPGDVPRYTYKHCIRCFCCQEVCPEKAIDIRTPLLGRLLRRIQRR